MIFKNYLLLCVLVGIVASSDDGFVFNGVFELGGVAEFEPDGGLFRLTNSTTFQIGHAFYSTPFRFKNSSSTKASSFSTTFIFAMAPQGSFTGHGMAFAIAPSKLTSGVASAQYLGLFNSTNNGDPSNHIFAIELDTFMNMEFEDISDNHVGIDVNGLRSVNSTSAGYISNGSGEFTTVDLANGERLQLWVEYDGSKQQLNVTLSPIHVSKPKVPLLSVDIDLSPIILDQMYVGFSSSTGRLVQNLYVLGWSFQLDGKAADLDIAKLPGVPGRGTSKTKTKKIVLAVGLTSAGVLLLVVTFCTALFFVRKKAMFTEVLEDWEVQFGPHRFAYKDLFAATGGFNEEELLGRGGFGKVYRGELLTSKDQIAVKRISHNSEQGMKEFIAEIGTIGRLRHPNLVRLLGYCRGKNELLLVYDYMPNASLDKFLYNKPERSLNWNQRFRIIKDVASALAFLHEEWVEVIIHRDIKASNVLLDGDLNGKLGDFGLARCSKHAETTRVAGTFGYMAPELAKTGKASTSTDVFAFGVFCLEVVCGRRPVQARASAEEVHLVDWVLNCLKSGEVLKAADPKLNGDFNVEEVNLVLRLGLICSHNVAARRPRMAQVVLYLRGHASVPEDLETVLQAQESAAESSNYSGSRTKDSISVASMTITERFQSVGR